MRSRLIRHGSAKAETVRSKQMQQVAARGGDYIPIVATANTYCRSTENPKAALAALSTHVERPLPFCRQKRSTPPSATSLAASIPFTGWLPKSATSTLHYQLINTARRSFRRRNALGTTRERERSNHCLAVASPSLRLLLLRPHSPTTAFETPY